MVLRIVLFIYVEMWLLCLYEFEEYRFVYRCFIFMFVDEIDYCVVFFRGVGSG